MTVNKDKNKQSHELTNIHLYLMLVFNRSNEIKLAKQGEVDTTKQMWRCRLSTSAYSSVWTCLMFTKNYKQTCDPIVSNMVDMSDPSVTRCRFLPKRAGF